MTKRADKPAREPGDDTALAPRPGSTLTRPAAGAPAGLENVERGDMTLPRLGLCQSLSPQRKKNDPKYIPKLEEGQLFNTITQNIYGGRVLVVPLFFYKTRILFNPLNQGGGIRCQAQDARVGRGDPGGSCDQCPLALFTKEDPPECNLFYNYAAAVMPEKGKAFGLDSLLVVSFKSTGLKVARDWNSRMRLRGVAAFAGIWEVRSVLNKNTAGEWYGPAVSPAGDVPADMLVTAEGMYQAVRDVQVAGRLQHDVSDLNPNTVHDAPEM